MKGMEYDIEMDLGEEEILSEITAEMAQQTCDTLGHFPQRTIADNGFTYQTVCGRCGRKIG